MKTVTKLFVAVVALFAYSCVTDTTEDLGVKIDGQTTEIVLSLEESRIQLGDKANGLYPIYWSEGDQISVNGVASQPLTAQQAGSTAATFTIQDNVSTPYSIAYPAAPAGKVMFAENQQMVSTLITPTMYGYSADGSGIELKHLTGVLKIGVTGSAQIKEIQISTIDRAPIAGEFDIPEFLK